jgi:hypothetical protein
MTALNFGLSCFFLRLSRQISGQHLSWAPTVSFYILSNPPLTSHSNINAIQSVVLAASYSKQHVSRSCNMSATAYRANTSAAFAPPLFLAVNSQNTEYFGTNGRPTIYPILATDLQSIIIKKIADARLKSTDLKTG